MMNIFIILNVFFSFFSTDLRSELETRVKKQVVGDSEEFGVKHHSALLTAHSSTVSMGISTSPQIKSMVTPTLHPCIPQPQPITPSARISALNMVGDLLRKVGVSPWLIPSLLHIISGNLIYNVHVFDVHPDKNNTHVYCLNFVFYLGTPFFLKP